MRSVWLAISAILGLLGLAALWLAMTAPAFVENSSLFRGLAPGELGATAPSGSLSTSVSIGASAASICAFILSAFSYLLGSRKRQLELEKLALEVEKLRRDVPGADQERW